MLRFPTPTDLDDAAFVARAATLAADPLAEIGKAERVPHWGRPEPAVTEADADEFQSRQTHRLGALKSECVADHPLPVAGRAREGLPEDNDDA